MKHLARRIGIFLVSSGFDPRLTLSSLRFVFGYIRDLIRWSKTSKFSEGKLFQLRLLPILSDKFAASGTASGHYFHQDLWAARLIFKNKPKRHIDVGSRIDGFVSHLLTFMEVDVVDIRALSSKVTGLNFLQADMMSDKSIQIKPASSISCLHALEHFGLGRYGDPLRPDGWRIGIKRLADLVELGGRLYLSVPIGSPAVEFNAHRIFHPNYIIDEAAKNGLTLVEFAYVDDAGDYYEQSVPLSVETSALLSNMVCACGFFLFSKG
jgi:hypothetical protein